MRYEGPIYRPPSEADSLLIQATVGCPHNRCTFCMVYRKGPAYRVRPVADIVADLNAARKQHGQGVRRIFFPAGNTIAMPTDELSRICEHAHRIFPTWSALPCMAPASTSIARGPLKCGVSPRPA